ncbi:hypothetical protein TNCV_2660581 [Trichonephila clavipes]|uniref:Uncharacterized protein n=1 Tax=Trichonephila clavipes TaxID=2585209 RepID=A0A8X6RFN6_TRICX|nr:hypothetical protein TNCV_2660581 [Trichonephila clavipes]
MQNSILKLKKYLFTLLSTARPLPSYLHHYAESPVSTLSTPFPVITPTALSPPPPGRTLSPPPPPPGRTLSPPPPPPRQNSHYYTTYIKTYTLVQDLSNRGSLHI